MSQEMNVPLTLSSKGSRVPLKLKNDAEICDLILDPRGIVWRMQGLYAYMPKSKVVNELRALRDQREIAKYKRDLNKLWLSWSEGWKIDAEIGEALFDCAEKLRGLKRLCKTAIANAEKAETLDRFFEGI